MASVDVALSLSPELVFGLYVRGLGLVTLISFLSITPQIVRSAGREGGLPIGLRLAKMRRDFPGARRFLYFPTLLWVSHGDAMLRGLSRPSVVAQQDASDLSSMIQPSFVSPPPAERAGARASNG